MARVSTSARVLVRERDGLWCVRLHVDGRRHGTELHHRRTAGMGGTRDNAAHLPGNLVHLCHWCHLDVTDMTCRGQSQREGFYVPQGQDPTTVPLLYRGRWVLLRHDGQMDDTKAPA